MKLVNNDTGEEIRLGDYVTLKDGVRTRLQGAYEPGTVTGGRGGRVYLTDKSIGMGGLVFPSVINAKFVNED